jgi:hypothetical protein
VTDGSPEPSILADAERKGFIRGLNVGFVCIGALAAIFVCYRLFFELPKFEQIFRQVKVPMPGLTLLVFKTREIAVVLFLLLTGLCIWATRSQGQKRVTIVLNALLFGGALFWLFVVTMALHLPFLGMHEGIGRPPH